MPAVRHSVSAKHRHVVELSEMHSQVPSRRQLQQRVIIMRVNLKAFFYGDDTSVFIAPVVQCFFVGHTGNCTAIDESLFLKKITTL